MAGLYVTVVVGVVVSIVKALIVNRLLELPRVSVTLILQLLYVHSASALKYISLLPKVAQVVVEEQSPE